MALRIVQLLAVLLVIGATIAVQLPAAWLGDWLQRSGKLRLVDPRGTVWSGSAMVAVSDGRRAFLLPGRVSWSTSLEDLGFGGIAVELRHPMVHDRLRVVLSAGEAQVDAGRANAPAAVLAVLGVPFNTLRPGGALVINWSRIRVERGAATGDVRVEWQDAQSALSHVAPLGDFSLDIRLRGQQGQIDLVTLRGPLLLEGTGSLHDGRLTFTGQASAEQQMLPALMGLIGVLGQRSGDRAALRLEI